MPSCAAYGCTKRPDKDRQHSVTFHRFLKENGFREKWVQATIRANFQPSKSAVLCSDHFTTEDIDRTSISCVRLKESAVPSVFDAFPAHLKTDNNQRKPPINRPLPEIPPSQISITSPPSADTPEKTALKRKLFETEKKMVCSRRKIKLLLQSKRRLMKKNAELKNVISDLKKHDLLSSGSIDILQTCSGGVQDLLKRKFSKAANKSVAVSYSPELRSFALTPHFYSPRAYNYIRKMFDTCLPHTRTISIWYNKLDNSPGFTKTAFAALKTRADLGEANGKSTPVALMMDEVAIRQHVKWDEKRYQGYIDMGTELDEDSLPLAKEFLTFMAVSINGSWKLPIGYFFIDGMRGEERKNLVKSCLEQLHEVGVTVVSLTLDGAASNISMLKLLGVNIDNPSNVKSSVPHPITGFPVYAFLDACHMLKLVRNTLADKGSLCIDNDLINWEFIVSLNKLQECEGLHLSIEIYTDGNVT
ncbi:hypothetical protein SNE40_019984 [Patella caerulea]|uniref:THAP-type domain-containing protein n=1 Tax=Patella caerulea TaxID=87958 RepID=A0AAN8G1W0_PATCE